MYVNREIELFSAGGRAKNRSVSIFRTNVISLVYARQGVNRTDYFENSLGCEFGKPALGAFIGFTA